MVFWLSVFGSRCIGGGGVREISKQVVFVLFVFSFLKEFCPSCKTAKCFPNQGEPKFGQIRAKSKAALKFRHKSVMP